ncbi:MAG: TIGR03936 family radical SAM-associated protein [Clostridia bacterium]|nr:TIGR03936 family radical SAM-associated protein [Clostridia bacterium]
MIAFKYTKTDGAEYLSHLDLLRHIDRTLRRAGIQVNYSEGFNKHARIFMGNPIALGVKSVAEFCTVDCGFTGNFKEIFNAFSPRGVKCIDYKIVEKNAEYAESIKECAYIAKGINQFDVSEVLNKDGIIITDLRGRSVDIRPRIYGLDYSDGGLKFTLGCGTSNLRPDLFCTFLCGIYGGSVTEIIKTESIGENTF